MSSQEEGLGSSVLDAFLNKVPVVSTDAGGLNEIISYGRGIKCAKKDPLALAKGINDILSLPEDYRLMADKAYEYAHTQHSPEFITQRYLHTFFSEK